MEESESARWARLMGAAQGGDRDSYALLLREIIPVLYRVTRNRCPMARPDQLEDVVQETLQSLHAARHTYDPSRPFLPWVLAIARFRLADEQRKWVRSAQRETEFGDGDETFYRIAPNSEYAGVDGDRLRKAVARLSPSQRTAVELIKLREMSLKQAAAASGMSIAALKVAVHRAMKALRTIMGGSQ